MRRLFRPGDTETAMRKKAARWIERGLAAERSRDVASALQCFDAAVEADPNFAAAHVNRGIALAASRRFDEALAAYDRALALDPQAAPAHFNAALVHAARSQSAEAEARFRAGLEHQPDNADAWIGLANLLESAARPDDALAALREALAVRPDHPGALLNAGALLRRMDRLEEAIDNDRRLVELEPENVVVQQRLAASLQALGRDEEAETAYRAILALQPDDRVAATELGLLLHQSGRAAEATPTLFRVFAAHPEDSRVKNVLVDALSGVQFQSMSDVDRSILQRLCSDSEINAQSLMQPVLSLIAHHEGVAKLRAVESKDPLGSAAIGAFMADALVLAALPAMLFADPALEHALARLRGLICAHVAHATADGGADPRVPLSFVCALARNSFLASYAMHVPQDERGDAAHVRAAAERALAQSPTPSAALEHVLAAAAMYEPLNALPGFERLLRTSTGQWSASFQPVVETQVAEHCTERELAATIERLTPIGDSVSVAVREQYEQNPYPRWLSVKDPGPETFEALWRRLHGKPAAIQPAAPLPILVAGCGTGRHPIQVARVFPDADILAVDLSIASLAYAKRMTQQRAVRNVRYCQADLLQLRSLERRFAIIECGGVLHHLADPLAGWRVLRDLLEPYGLMRIALYSEKARASLRAAREFAAGTGFDHSAEGIRRLRHAILQLPSGHPAREVTNSVDFYGTDECRDLILHVCEHRFTLPQIAQCLEDLDLRLLALQVPPFAYERFKQMFPDSDAKTDLAAWDRFEDVAPETFMGMYRFWCCPASAEAFAKRK